MPPPVHGVSIINKNIIDFFKTETNFKIKLTELNVSFNFSDIQKVTVCKFLLSIKIFFNFFYNILSFKPSVIYLSIFPFGKAFFYKDLYYLLLAKIFKRNKVIVHLHNTGIYKDCNNKLKKRIYNKIFNNINVIFLSQDIASKEFNKLNIRNKKVFILKNGIKDETNFIRNYKDTDKINILFLSNFFVEKGLFILLDAIKNILQTHTNTRLLIAGQDINNQLNKLNNYIKSNNLNCSITIKTDVFDDEKDMLYKNADIFVFPSYFEETSSLVIMEAMKYGLPIIASSSGEIPNIVEDNKTALLFKPKNSTELKKQLIKLIEDPELRKYLGTNAQKYFKENYTLSIFNKNLSKIINTVVNE